MLLSLVFAVVFAQVSASCRRRSCGGPARSWCNDDTYKDHSCSHDSSCKCGGYCGHRNICGRECESYCQTLTCAHANKQRQPYKCPVGTRLKRKLPGPEAFRYRRVSASMCCESTTSTTTTTTSTTTTVTFTTLPPYQGEVYWTRGKADQNCMIVCGGQDQCLESEWPSSLGAFKEMLKKIGETSCTGFPDGDWQVNPGIYVGHDSECYWRVQNAQEKRCAASDWAVARYCPCKTKPVAATTTAAPSPTTTESPRPRPRPSRRRSKRRRRRNRRKGPVNADVRSVRRRRGRRSRRRRRQAA